MATRLGASDGRDSFAFGEKLLNLLDEGAFSTTYKYALLLALIDVCMEKTGSQGQAPEAISTRELAEKTLEIYWPQAAPFVLSKGASILKQSGKGQAEIVSAIRKFREHHAPDPSAPLFRARAAAPERYEDLVGEVEWILIEMPIPRLQLVGNSADPFIYQVGWNTTVKRRGIERPGFERRIRLVTGAGERLA